MAEPAQAAFPSGFLWGAATASFQIEGGREDRGDCIWDTFSHTPGKVMNNDHVCLSHHSSKDLPSRADEHTWIRGRVQGDVACDHYHKLEEDVQMMKDMGLKAYRFSISWPRLWPDGTRASESAKGAT
jgi:beta-glucosidase